MRLAKNLTIVLLLTEPTKTLKSFLSRNNNSAEIFLLIACGCLFQTSMRYRALGTHVPFIGQLIAYGLMNIFFGSLSLLLFCVFLVASTRLFNGNARFKPTLAVIAWSFLPLIIGVIFYILALTYSGRELLQKATSSSDIYWLKIGISSLRAILMLFSIFILFKGIKLINHFSNWKAIGTIAVTLCLFILVPYILFVIFKFWQ